MRKLGQWLLVSLVAVGGAAVSAQQPPMGAESTQDNMMRAARLSYVKGPVHVDGQGDPLDGVANMPVVEGQRISTGDDGEAEIEFEDGSVVRLTPNSAVELNQMSAGQSGGLSTAVGLLGGVYYMDLRASDQVHYIVDAADERIEPRQNSVIRVRMDQPPAEVSLFEGDATVSREGGFSSEVRGGQSIRGDATAAGRYYLSDRIDEDSWDRWNEDREQEAANDANLRTDAQAATGDQSGYGWSDLDSYGNWYDVPGEGQVWQPEQASDPNFDPYGYGSWVYYPTSGYVWVSSYPWGWKPFRCGYWSYYGGFGWGWVPSGCGVRGWGGFGGYGGFSIRIKSYPSGYRYPVRPVPGRGTGWSGGRPPRRVIPIGTRPPISPRISSREGRSVSIGGKTYQPLPRRNGYTQRGGSALGSGLRRDYRVDSRTRQPDFGRAPSQPGTAIVPGPGWRSVDNGRPGNRNAQRGGSQTVPATPPANVDTRRGQYNTNRGGQGNPQNRGGNVNQPGNTQQPTGGRIPSANSPIRRRDDAQPDQNNQPGSTPNWRQRRRDYQGRPAQQPSAPPPGGVGIPAQPTQNTGNRPAQQPGSNADQQRQQRQQVDQQQQMQQDQRRQQQDQQRQQFDQQRLQQQRQQQIDQMRQQTQQRQQDQQRTQDQQRQQQQRTQDQQRQQQLQQQRDQQVQQQRQQIDQQQRQQQDQQRQQQMQQRQQQMEQLRQQQQQRQQMDHQQRQQQDQQRQQQMEQRQQQMQQRQQQMEQNRQQQRQQPQSQPAPQPSHPPDQQQQKFGR